MNMKDKHSSTKVFSLIDAAALAADTTPPAVDLQGFRSAEIALAIGIGGITFSGTNKIEFKMTHSDDNSVYTDVADKDVLGATGIVTGIIKSLIAAHAAAAVYRFGYIGGKRYLKLLPDFSGTHGSPTPIAAICVAGNATVQPVANQA